MGFGHTKAIFVVFGIVFFALHWTNIVYAATSPSLGTAGAYSILAGSSVTNTGATTISGNVGISPGAGGSPNYTGFGTVTLGGAIHDADGAALTAQNDRTTAYAALASQGCDTDYGAVTTELAGKNLVPGVYCSSSFHLSSGTLTLNGDSSGVWIFKSASDLIVSGGSSTSIVFTEGGLACNVWWRVVSTATFDANSSLVGTILADTSITFAAGASLNGRALASTAAVTMSGNSITGPTCSSSTSGINGSSNGGGGGGNELVPRMNVTKSASPVALPLGSGSVTYTYRVTNVGDVSMSNIWLKDDKCFAVKLLSGDRNHDSMLDLDELWTYRCTQIVSKNVTNVATVHGFANGRDVYDTARATVLVSIPITSSPSVIVSPRFPNTGIAPEDSSGSILFRIFVTLLSWYVG